MIASLPLRSRGWLLLAAAAAALLLAFLLGRRDLLVVAVFCVALPAVACAGLLWFKPGFAVKRQISPALARAGSPVSVVLDVRGHAPGGSRARLAEALPPSFYGAASFGFPNPVVPRSLLSRYEYQVVPRHRGVFTVGPLHALFTDPFGVAELQRSLDDGGPLTVAPAAVELPSIALSDGRGQDGSRTTKELAHASQDDAMTREYRAGDPLRRVHWAVTARQGKLMVRAEESVTAPEAALIMDLRHHAFGDPSRNTWRTTWENSAGLGAGRSNRGILGVRGIRGVRILGGRGSRGTGAGSHAIGGTGLSGEPPVHSLRTTDTFEKAVTAVASIAAHMMERGYSLRVLDQAGRPGFATSASAIAPQVEDFSGNQGVFDVAASLAALELAGPLHAGSPAGPDTPAVTAGTGAAAGPPGIPAAPAAPATAARATAGARDADSGSAFGNELAYKLHHGRRRGPLVAVTGLLSETDARLLAGISESTQSACALLLCHDPEQAAPALEILRSAGWRATALTPWAPLDEAWMQLDRSHSLGLAP